MFAVLALVVTACGASNTSDGVASLDGTGDTESDGTSSDQSLEEWREAALDYAECMRKEGVNMPDPQEGEHGFAITPDADLGVSEADFEKANENCRHFLQGVAPPALSDEEQEQVREETLRFTECMRKHGIDIPDPKFDDTSAAIDVGPPGSDTDPQSPEFQEAQEACERYAPGAGETP